MQYDAENRITVAPGNQQYAYDGQNKRIWAVTWDSTYSFYTSETYYFYSPQGTLMAQFTPQYQSQTGTLGFLTAPPAPTSAVDCSAVKTVSAPAANTSRTATTAPRRPRQRPSQVRDLHPRFRTGLLRRPALLCLHLWPLLVTRPIHL